MTCFIVMLLGMLVVTFMLRQRVSNRRILCESRQMGLARAILYNDMLTGSFPGYRDEQTIDLQGKPRPASWVFFTLPYLKDTTKPNFNYTDEKKRLDEKGLETVIGPYAEVFKNYGPKAPAKWRGKTPATFLRELVCPNNPRPNDDVRTNCWMSFVANTGMPDTKATDVFPADWTANGVFTDQFPGQRKRAERASFLRLQSGDGAGVTLMLAENIDSGLWTDVTEAQVGFCWTPKSSDSSKQHQKILWINERVGEGDGSIRFARPSSYHKGGVNVAFCDGRTTFLSQDIDVLTYTRLMTSDSSNVRWPGTETLVEVTEKE